MSEMISQHSLLKMQTIRVILVGTTHPGNIGAAARAMKTMGLCRLYLVNPKQFPSPIAHAMAAGADDILEQAVVTHSLSEALENCQCILGTSARPRDLALPGLTPRACAEHIRRYTDTSEVAVVFGREHAGLTNDELLQCHYHINIPSNPQYQSLNLAQAVQIIAYELYQCFSFSQSIQNTTSLTLATADEMEKFYTHLKEVLIEIEFLKPANPKKLMQRLRRLFNRAMLEQNELNILRGILSNLLRALKRIR